MLRKLSLMLGLAVLLNAAPVFSNNGNCECHNGVSKTMKRTSLSMKRTASRTGTALKTGLNKTTNAVKTTFNKTRNRIKSDDELRDKQERM